MTSCLYPGRAASNSGHKSVIERFYLQDDRLSDRNNKTSPGAEYGHRERFYFAFIPQVSFALIPHPLHLLGRCLRSDPRMLCALTAGPCRMTPGKRKAAFAAAPLFPLSLLPYRKELSLLSRLSCLKSRPLFSALAEEDQFVVFHLFWL